MLVVLGGQLGVTSISNVGVEDEILSPEGGGIVVIAKPEVLAASASSKSVAVGSLLERPISSKHTYLTQAIFSIKV